MTPVEAPKVGNTVEECIVGEWRKQKGDQVVAGEVLTEIETDKATFEITAPVSGTLVEICCAEGALVPVLTTLCMIGEPEENVEAAAPLSPRARRFAAEQAFEPPPMAGSGPGGRVLEADVRAAYAASPPQPAGEALSNVRETIARRVRESLAATAQYTLHTSAAAGPLLALRESFKTSSDRNRITVGDIVLFAVVRALLETPALNAEYVEGRIRQHGDVHLGFACDTDRGLLVPVVRNAQNLTLPQLSATVHRLADQAVRGSIAAGDLSGATFTVSNLGSLGIESFTPILNPPQVAILGVGAIQLKPRRTQAGFAFIDSIGLSLTCDHQVIDGAPGARFLQALVRIIEQVDSIVPST